MREKARAKKALGRQLQAEEFMLSVLRTTGEQHGVPVVLFDPYADAVSRYNLEAWRPGADRRTAGETMERGKALYREMLEAMAAYILAGGSDRWRAFDDSVCEYVGFALVAVEVAQAALHNSDVGFSEATDPAFAGLVE